MFLNMKKVSKLCSDMMRDYFVFDSQISNLKEQLECEGNHQDVNSFSKNKKVEKQANSRLMLENKINQITAWQDIISDVIAGYKKTYKSKYDYIIEKFMNHKKDREIEEELFMSTTTQYRYKTEIVYQVAMIALSENLITIADMVDNDT